MNFRPDVNGEWEGHVQLRWAQGHFHQHQPDPTEDSRWSSSLGRSLAHREQIRWDLDHKHPSSPLVQDTAWMQTCQGVAFAGEDIKKEIKKQPLRFYKIKTSPSFLSQHEGQFLLSDRCTQLLLDACMHSSMRPARNSPNFPSSTINPEDSPHSHAFPQTYSKDSSTSAQLWTIKNPER